MITVQEQFIIKKIARRYGVKRVILFGSSLSKKNARDIDLAAEGVPPKKFFKFYGALLFDLPRPVDLVDLSHDTKFTRLIRQEGRLIYG